MSLYAALVDKIGESPDGLFILQKPIQMQITVDDASAVVPAFEIHVVTSEDELKAEGAYMMPEAEKILVNTLQSGGWKALGITERGEILFQRPFEVEGGLSHRLLAIGRMGTVNVTSCLDVHTHGDLNVACQSIDSEFAVLVGDLEDPSGE